MTVDDNDLLEHPRQRLEIQQPFALAGVPRMPLSGAGRPLAPPGCVACAQTILPAGRAAGWRLDRQTSGTLACALHGVHGRDDARARRSQRHSPRSARHPTAACYATAPFLCTRGARKKIRRLGGARVRGAPQRRVDARRQTLPVWRNCAFPAPPCVMPYGKKFLDIQ